MVGFCRSELVHLRRARPGHGRWIRVRHGQLRVVARRPRSDAAARSVHRVRTSAAGSASVSIVAARPSRATSPSQSSAPGRLTPKDNWKQGLSPACYKLPVRQGEPHAGALSVPVGCSAAAVAVGALYLRARVHCDRGSHGERVKTPCSCPTRTALRAGAARLARLVRVRRAASAASLSVGACHSNAHWQPSGRPLAPLFGGRRGRAISDAGSLPWFWVWKATQSDEIGSHARGHRLLRTAPEAAHNPSQSSWRGPWVTTSRRSIAECVPGRCGREGG